MLKEGDKNKEYWNIIWSQFKNGDKEAFAILYNLHIDSLYQYGLKFCNDEETIKDAIQEVFLDLYLKREKNTASPDNLKYYLLLSLKRNLIKKLQSDRRFDRGEMFERKQTELEFSIEYLLIEKEQEEEVQNRITDALNQLPCKQKEAVYLRFNEALDYAEIAIILGITIESVRKQVYRALKTIRETLDSKTFTMLFFFFFQKKQKKESMFELLEAF